jgi:xanthine/uracil permease
VNNSSPKAQAAKPRSAKQQLPNPKNQELLAERTAEAGGTIEMRASDVTLKVRRAPKFLPFVLSGMILGIIVAFILNATIAPENRTEANILGYLVLYCAGGGLAVGVLSAVVLDAFFAARAKQVSATKLER